MTVGSGSGWLARAGTTTVTGRLTAKARVAFRRAIEVKVSAHMGARDGAGNASGVTRSVNLKRDTRTTVGWANFPPRRGLWRAGVCPRRLRIRLTSHTTDRAWP